MRRPMTAVLALAVLASPVIHRPAGAAGDSAARRLIERSIAHHDPGGRWWTSARAITLRQPRADGVVQRSAFALHPDAARFELRVEEGSLAIEGRVHGDSCTLAPGGEDAEASRSRFQKYDCDRMKLYRAYYGYLFNVPMNLLDDAGAIEPDVIETVFLERDVHAVRITYGTDQPVWEYYFDPATAALVGCRFTRDPEWKTGEYIVYAGEIEADGVRLPRERAWHTNEDLRWLGTDAIESLRIEPAADAGGPE